MNQVAGNNIHMAPPLGDPNVIALLQMLLAEAKAGKIVGLTAVFSKGPAGGLGSHTVGADIPSLYLGCALAQRGMEAMVAQPQAQSRILKPIGGVM